MSQVVSQSVGAWDPPNQPLNSIATIYFWRTMSLLSENLNIKSVTFFSRFFFCQWLRDLSKTINRENKGSDAKKQSHSKILELDSKRISQSCPPPPTVQENHNSVFSMSLRRRSAPPMVLGTSCQGRDFRNAFARSIPSAFIATPDALGNITTFYSGFRHRKHCHAIPLIGPRNGRLTCRSSYANRPRATEVCQASITRIISASLISNQPVAIIRKSTREIPRDACHNKQQSQKTKTRHRKSSKKVNPNCLRQLWRRDQWFALPIIVEPNNLRVFIE